MTSAMAERRLSRLQRFILALAWESCRKGIEREGKGTLFFYTDEIYLTYYGDWSATDEGWGGKPHKHSVSISRSLKGLAGFIEVKERCYDAGGFTFIILKPEPEIAAMCRDAWNEGGLKLISLSNIKNAESRAEIHKATQERIQGGPGAPGSSQLHPSPAYASNKSEEP